ncbi:MAG TPA: Rne/Rng family ribonuclease [Stellaceae bacterium]|nr:Rne/Rng family ribonuclease [Stellaceae bacterium]
MAKRMLIDATHPEETRVVVLDGNRLDEFDFETSTKKQVKGNIYLAKITRVEPSLQAAFVDFGGNRHGFLAFSEIHPDYYRIPIGDRAPHYDERDERDNERRGRRGGHRDHRRSDASESEHAAVEDETPHVDHADGAPVEEQGPPELPARPAESQAGEFGTVESEAGDIAAPPSAELVSTDEPYPASHTVASEYSPPPAEAPHEEAGDRDYARAERSVAETQSALPAKFETRESAAADAEPEPTIVQTGGTEFVTPQFVTSELVTSEFVASEAGAESQTAESQTAESQTAESQNAESQAAESVETVGGDEFEEAARQRSRSLRHYKIQEVVKRRQIMLVQVTKEERGNKGAALTTYLSLAGRYCVLMPNTGRGGGVSRKITSATDRRRLKELLEELELPEGMGVIVRTAGSERSKAEIKRDLEYLLRLWDEIRSLTLQSTAPALIYEEGNLIKRSIRDLYARDIDEVLVEGEEGYKTAKAFMKMLMPSHAKRVQPYRDTIPLFHRFQVESQIDLIHSPVVQLRSGGYIVINPTEALVAIDVNSGRSTKERNIEETALRTNLEAAEEVARQLRLRDLAGLIVIDFIDMDEHRNQGAVERRLKEGMKYDRARIQLGRISPFGLLELSRQRLRPSLVEASTQPCPHCAGTGHIRSTESTALHVLRAIEEEGIRRRSAEICIYVPTAVALYVLNQKREALAQIELRYGFRVTVANDDTLIPPAFRLERLRNLTPAEAATLPPAIVQLPPSVEDDDEEIDEGEAVPQAAASANGEEKQGAEMSEEERGRRRRRRRRRRRPGDEPEAGHGQQAHDGPYERTGQAQEHGEAGVGQGGEHAAVEFARPFPATMEGEPQSVEPTGEGFTPVPGPAGEGDAGRKRRRRGKRGGRRRGRGDAVGRSGGDDGAGFASDESAPMPAAERIEIVHQQASTEEAAPPSIEPAFTSAPLPISEETIDTAEAPVMEAGETLRGYQPPSPVPAMSEPERPKEEHAHAMAGLEESAAAKTGSTIPEPKLVTEKPANPKRGWWQRLIDS